MIRGDESGSLRKQQISTVWVSSCQSARVKTSTTFSSVFFPLYLWLLSSRSNTEQEAGRSGRLRFLQPHPGQGDAHLSVHGSPSPPEDPPSHSSSPNAPEGHRPLEETLDSRLKPTSPSFQFQVLWPRESLLHCSRNIWTPFASNTLSLSLSLSCSLFLTSAFFFFIPSAQLV